jgi:hypothetical protein
MPPWWRAGRRALTSLQRRRFMGKEPAAPVRSVMKNLGYGSATILVSDATASTVLHYAAILAQTGGGDVVDVPTTDDAGLMAHASVVLGPGIPVMATNAPDDLLEDDNRDFVADITGRVGVAMTGTPKLD